jgi:hypothetical protein
VLELQSTRHRIYFNKDIAEMGLTHESRPLRQSHVISNSDNLASSVSRVNIVFVQYMKYFSITI